MSLTSTHFFCGGGGDTQGLREAGFEPTLAANHDEASIDTHSANFPDCDHLLANLEHVEMRRLPRTQVLWGSPICFPASTTVLTRRGPTPIEEVQVGDDVLTHLGRWRPVIETMRNLGDTVVVRGHGHNELETTAEHPFYARRVDRVWNNPVRDYRKQLGAPEWVEAKNLDSHMWATPMRFGDPGPIPPVGGRGMAFSELFWWMVGRWLGDGYVRIVNGGDGLKSRRDVYICCGDHEADALAARLADVAPASGTRCGKGELRWRRTHPATVTVFETSHGGLAEWLTEHFGRHAHGKRLPAWTLTMTREWRAALLDGYLSADGNVNRGRYTAMMRFSSVSKPLAVGVRLLAVSLGHGASMYAPGRRTYGVIQGRMVAMRPSWSVGWTIDPSPKHHQFVDDGPHRWSKVRSVRDGRRGVEVYNLSVAEDESYVADGIVVHNCTEISPAGGRKRRKVAGQLGLFDDDEPLPDSSFERTRVTALTVIAAAETHRYDVVMGENVVEFGTDWELFDWWISGMHILGYEHQLISVNAAHVGGPGNPAAPQWRDRLFFVFWRKGIPMPTLQPRPLAPCHTCGEEVQAVQWWKNTKRRIGKYRQQYLYRCPNSRCRHEVVEPFVRPASEIIDWNHIGTRIGDRKRPLAANTIRRIEAGLVKFSTRQVMVTLNHGGHDGRAYPPETAPLPARTIKIGDGLLTPPMLVPCGGTRNDTPWPLTDPMRTVLTRDAEAVLSPEPFVAELRRHGTARAVSDPLSTISAGGNHHALVVPYYTNGQAASSNEPLSTVTVKDRHALVTDAVRVEDCHLRMVQPREQFLAQRFPEGYILRGNKSQQTAQAGNAVPVNVAQWIGQHVYAALDGGRS